MVDSKERALSPWERVQIARLNERPNADFYIENIFEDFMEFHGDRLYGDDKAIIIGIGRLNNISVTVVGIRKGSNTKENVERNFGMPHPEGYRKALRAMKEAEKFNRPVICFIDTPGAYCGIGAEERGQGHAIATNILEMSRLKTPIISIVIGEGGSGGALALGVGDKVWMLENSIYSILSPEGFATILWKDVTRAVEAAEVMKSTAQDLKSFNIIDKVIKEPIGGAHKNPRLMASVIKKELEVEIPKLQQINKEKLLNQRYLKFRGMGY